LFRDLLNLGFAKKIFFHLAHGFIGYIPGDGDVVETRFPGIFLTQ